MTDQPPVQPPQLPQPPTGAPGQQPGQVNPATQPIPAAAQGDPAAVPLAAPAAPAAPTATGWHQATSTHAGRWAIAIAAGVLACLMLLGIGVGGLLVLRNHDRFGLMGQRSDGFSRGQLGRGEGGSGDDGRNNGRIPNQRGLPGAPGGGARGFGGLGGLGGALGGGALHGTVTATVNGSARALLFQRGQVTAVSATSITLKSSDGFIGTYGRTSSTNSMLAAPVTGGQAFVLAQASDKVALTIVPTPAGAGVGPSS
jgi:hypothetical protein